jgi:type II secretion system protein J
VKLEHSQLGPARRDTAFTLIEIMVALAIFTMVVAAIYSSWLAIMRGSKAGIEAAAAVQRQRMAISTLQQALGATRSFAVDIQYYSFVAENGDDASLSFVSHLSPSFPRSGKFDDFDVRRVTFSVEGAADGTRQLVLRQNAMLKEWDQDEKEHPLVLAKDVRKFEMEFLDVKSGEWIDEWTQTNQLPKLLKITLQVGGATRDAKPQDELTRIVSLPSVAVQAGWQIPGRQAPNQPPP